jgi:hypothetical protein
MNASDFTALLNFTRRKTIELLDKIAAEPDPQAVLGWRPGPGRAHIGWQLMHIGATDDRHLNIRMHEREPASPDNVARFAGGSTPDENIPTVDQIRTYLTERRDALIAHLQTLSEADFDGKPNDKAPWVYSEWFTLLNWHEAHHQGQAHLTYNLYKASH